MTKKMNQQAFKEGWCVSYTGLEDAVHNIYELQRVDELNIFINDDEAIKHVVKMAEADVTGLHAKTLKWLAKHSPNELESVVWDVIGRETYSALIKKLNIKIS